MNNVEESQDSDVLGVTSHDLQKSKEVRYTHHLKKGESPDIGHGRRYCSYTKLKFRMHGKEGKKRMYFIRRTLINY